MPILTWIIAAGTAIGILYAGWRWLRPYWASFWRDLRAGRDALVGRPAMLDSITGVERVPALPGIGQRMDTQEAASVETAKQLGEMAQAMASLAQSHERLNDHDVHLARHDEQIAELFAGAVERVVGKVEQIELWRAVEAAHNAPTDADVDPDLT